MSNELMRYTHGGEVVPLRDRKLAKHAKEVVDQVRLAGLKADGAMALGGHIMEGLIALDDRKNDLSKGDPVTDVLLTELMVTTIHQVKTIQANVYRPWRL